jgi:SAM-dependent methyltransferase
LCATPLEHTLVDLGAMPLANALIAPERMDRPEPRFPLHARVCAACLLVQVDDVATPGEIFSDYTYFSSYSASWVEHARRFAVMAAQRFGLGPRSQVVEIASNDGYLLKHFVALGVPALGVEPAANVAEVARAAGVPTEVAFFGAATAQMLAARGQMADLIVANNVMAHVPELNDFVAGFRTLLKPAGVISIEFPHVLNLLREVQFDTIYHEHFSYLSLGVVSNALARHGLAVFDVERLPTHGGSLRVFAGHPNAHAPTPSVEAVLRDERADRLDSLAGYRGFRERVETVRRDLLAFLEGAQREGKTVVAYGAAAKGATLLNYCAIGTDRIGFAVDRSPHKQGRAMPGCRLPIRAPDAVFAARPDYLLILPWNLREEIAREMAAIRGWGGRFVVAIPALTVLP